MKLLAKSNEGILSDIENKADPETLAQLLLDKSYSIDYIDIGPPRASSLYDACMRKHVIGSINHLAEKRFTGVGSMWTFSIGDAVHWAIQNTPIILGDNRYGFWKCSACKKLRKFGSVLDVRGKCEYCGADGTSTFYHEYGKRINSPYIFSFHVDMFILVDDVLRILEIKTIKGEEFKKLMAPLIQHEFQVNAYMYGCELSKIRKYVDSRIAYILYVSKDTGGRKFNAKRFIIRRGFGLEEHSTQKLIEDRLGAYMLGINEYPKNIPNKHPECERDPGCYRANNCPAKEVCFK